LVISGILVKELYHSTNMILRRNKTRSNQKKTCNGKRFVTHASGISFTIKLAQRHNETCYLAAARHKFYSRLRLKCDGTRTETRFRLSAKWTSLFKSAGASVQSTTGSRDVRISAVVMLDTPCSEVV